MRSIPNHGKNRERGTVGIHFGIFLGIAFGVGALAIDLGRALVTRAELLNAADSAVLAAGRELALIYRAQPRRDYKTWELTSGERARILAKAAEFSGLNEADGQDVVLRESDLGFGTFDATTGEITPTTRGVRAVAVVTRRDELANGAIPTTLGRVIGSSTLAVHAGAAAALSPVSTTPRGALGIPVGISSYWFEQNQCGPNSEIRFNPTGDLAGCAGWHTYTEAPANAHRLKDILDDMKAGTWQSPPTDAGDTEFEFIGGTIASAFPAIEALYDAKKDAAGEWSVLIPVYRSSNCSNPHGALPIIGYATARITSVKKAPAKTITANIDCGIVDFGAGEGGGDYGTLVGIPRMIQ